jgi:hypothetical protein
MSRRDHRILPMIVLLVSSNILNTLDMSYIMLV